MIVNQFYVEFLVELVVYLNWNLVQNRFYFGWTLCYTKQIRFPMVPLMKHGLGYLHRTRFAVCAFFHHTVTTQCDSGANWYFDIQIKKPTKYSALGRHPDLSLVCHMFRSSWVVTKTFATVKLEVHKVNGA
jgi:hypothetical protein